MISTVVLTYGKWNLTHQLLSDIRQFFPCEEVVVVDNGSEDGLTQEGVKFWSNLLPITFVRSEDNLGFSGGANLGIKEACEEKIVLISNDVRITNKWPISVIKGLSENEIAGGVFHTHDTGWNTFDGRTFPYLEGWFLATHYRTWETLGYFDEQYSPYDYEDIDFSTKAIDLGYGLVEIKDGLRHVGGGTIGYNPEREKITRANRERFMKKWL